MRKPKLAILLSILAAALYAINVPLSKDLLPHIRPAVLAGLLYIGAGAGVGLLMLVKCLAGRPPDGPRLERRDLPYTVAMVVLDIAAPILLMYGIATSTPASVSLLNNLEIVVTSLIALLIFKEKISPRLWLSIGLVTLGGMILGFEGEGSLHFSTGSLFVLGACVCWGMENNCTRSISDKSAEQIVLIKGIGSGLGSLAVALVAAFLAPGAIPPAESIAALIPAWPYVLAALALGFVAYGLSIKFYVTAQNILGAAKTSAFYSIAPFLGVGFAFLLHRSAPAPRFYVALAVMLLSTVLMVLDTLHPAKSTPD